MPVLKATAVSIQRGDATVLINVNLTVASGSIAVLRGRSGSGKSSLLHAFAGLIDSTGHISIDEESMPSNRDDRAAWRGARVGLVDQDTELLPELSIQDNVQLPLTLRRIRNRSAKPLLRAFGLEPLANRRADEVSGGERQRGAIARGLVTGAKVLLLDEPTSALDEENARTVIKAIERAAKGGAAVIVATHDDVFEGVGTMYEVRDGTVHPCRR